MPQFPGRLPHRTRPQDTGRRRWHPPGCRSLACTRSRWHWWTPAGTCTLGCTGLCRLPRWILGCCHRCLEGSQCTHLTQRHCRSRPRTHWRWGTWTPRGTSTLLCSCQSRRGCSGRLSSRRYLRDRVRCTSRPSAPSPHRTLPRGKGSTRQRLPTHTAPRGTGQRWHWCCPRDRRTPGSTGPSTWRTSGHWQRQRRPRGRECTRLSRCRQGCTLQVGTAPTRGGGGWQRRGKQ